MNFYDIFKKVRCQYPKKLFITDGISNYTYAQFDEKIEQIANEWNLLITRRSVLILANSPLEQLLLFLAISYKEGVPILLHEELSVTEIRNLAIEEKIDWFVTLDGKLKRLNQFDEERNPEIFGVLSSGTMTQPKMMYRSCESWFAFFPIQNDYFNISSRSVLFTQGSLSFTANLNAILSTMFMGASVVATETKSPRKWWRLIQQNQVDVIYLIPTKLTLLIQQMKMANHQIKSIYTSSQFIFCSLAKQLKKLFPAAQIRVYYGTSEVSFLTGMTLEVSNNDSFRVGKPFPFVGISSSNNEIVVSTPFAIEGLSQPYATGDTGYVDEEGYLVLTGRKDDLVNVFGKKISLIQLEQNISSLPHLKEIALFSVKHKLKGNQIVVVYVPTASFNLIDAKRNYPFSWWKRSVIPRLSSGKVAISQLKNEYLKNRQMDEKKRFF